MVSLRLQRRSVPRGMCKLNEAIVPLVIFGLLSATICDAQQAVPLSKTAASIKVTVQKLAPEAKITVVRKDKTVETGSFVSSAEEEFVLYDTAVKANVPVKYEDVSSVKNGWSDAKKSSSHLGRNLLIAAVIVVAVVVILVVSTSHVSEN